MKLLCYSLVWYFSLFLRAYAAPDKCLIYNTNQSIAQVKADALSLILSSVTDCPQDIRELKTLLTDRGLFHRPTMVANRGRHNSKLGSFSLFETIEGSLKNSQIKVGPGEFYLGHFTVVNNGEVELDQKFQAGKLLIELIVWDQQHQLFNFYELIGKPAGAQWFYRGNSLDALKDNKNIYLKPGMGESKFGQRMRCSACHNSGAPIMKELSSPHNDWWRSQRPLAFSPNRVSAELEEYLDQMVDASTFAKKVNQGMSKLVQSRTYRSYRSQMDLAEQLRPLFCENEINLESDLTPAASQVQVPPAFLAHPWWKLAPYKVDQSKYQQLLGQYGMRFPETTKKDADHAWLAPVKGKFDLLTLQSLIKDQIIDQEFLFDVLAVDYAHPVLSANRCELLTLVPNVKGNWRAKFIENLEQSSLPAARELLLNLTSSERTASWHQLEVQNEVLNLTATDAFKKLMKVRELVFKSELSQNPMGQILEPGFRLIFPIASRVSR